MESTTTENSSIRDALESSFDQSVSETPAVSEETPVDTQASETEGYEAPAEEKTAEEAEKPSREYSRDEHGKFAEKKAKEAAKEGIQAGPKSGQFKEKSDPIERAPQSWKPEVREHWKNIPEDARREILRSEQHIQATLRETAEDRHLAKGFRDAVAPFMHFIKAENSDPIRAVDNLLTTAAKLRTGNVNEVAGMVAQIVGQYGSGRFGAESFIRALDEHLAGVTPQAQDPRIAEVEQRMMQQFAPALQMAQQFQQQQYQAQQQTDYQARSAVDDFMAQAEFGNDVRLRMAMEIETAAQQGVEMSLQDAYDRACWADPSIRKIMQQRSASEQAQRANQSAQRARSAAVSVGGSPALNPGNPGGMSIRDQIEFAMSRNG